MTQGLDNSEPVLTRRQAYGCLGLAGFSLAVAVLCVILGIMCMAKHGTYECIGLFSIFPLAFLLIGLVAGAVGLQRFTSAGTRRASPTVVGGRQSGWEPVAPIARRNVLPDVIILPGHVESGGEGAVNDTGRGMEQE